jgi:hypothetical protein
MLRAGRSWGSISDQVICFFQLPNHSSLIMALGWAQPLTEMSTTCQLTPEERAPSIHLIGGSVDPRAGLDDMKLKLFTLLRLELRPLGRPARGQSPYRLCYCSS